MTNLPVLSAERLSPSEVGRALREVGGFTLEPSIDADLCDAAVKVAHGFFAGPREEKLATAIERSPHFRGFSSMHNEREFREKFEKAMFDRLFFTPGAPVVFVSAMSGYEVDRMLNAAANAGPHRGPPPRRPAVRRIPGADPPSLGYHGASHMRVGLGRRS